jgi:hypothetical protein
MLRNLVLATFLILLALPAMAMPVTTGKSHIVTQDCHSKPAQGNDDLHDEQNMILHGCIGCIAPLPTDLLILQVLPLEFTPVAECVRALRGYTPRPGLPPPRG